MTQTGCGSTHTFRAVLMLCALSTI